MLIAAALWLLHRCTAEKQTGTGAEGAEKVSDERGAENTGTTVPDASPGAARPGSAAIERKLGEVLARLGENPSTAGQDDEAREAMLRRTSQYLLAMPPREAASAILRQLESGEDAPTGMRFQTGEDGLAGWPTWRVYLLDLLGSINPKMAADYARENIFVRYESADEWAVAMRSVLASAPPARQGAARTEISALLSRMLGQSAWRESPTDGMFEAMDFVAQTPDAAQHLAVMQRWAAEKNDGSIDAALQIVAERSATTQADRLLVALVSDPSLLASAPALRASVMGRADLGQAQQAEAVRSYLLRLSPGSDEANAFFAVFPNHRFSVAPGLASAPILPTAAQMRAADEAALRKMEVWMADPGLSPHIGSIQALEDKLRRMLQP